MPLQVCLAPSVSRGSNHNRMMKTCVFASSWKCTLHRVHSQPFYFSINIEVTDIQIATICWLMIAIYTTGLNFVSKLHQKILKMFKSIRRIISFPKARIESFLFAFDENTNPNVLSIWRSIGVLGVFVLLQDRSFCQPPEVVQSLGQN